MADRINAAGADLDGPFGQSAGGVLDRELPYWPAPQLCSAELGTCRLMTATNSSRHGANMQIAHTDRPPQTASSRRFTLLDAMVLIAATGIGFVPIRLFLWENWHFPEEWSVPEVWRSGLEINVSLVPLALSLSLALWLLALKHSRGRLRRAFRRPGMAACTITLAYTILSSIGYVVFLQFSRAWDRGVFNDPNSAMLWIRIGMQPIFLVGGAIASVWIVMWLGRTWRAERSWIDRAGRALGFYWIVLSVLFGWGFFLWG